MHSIYTETGLKDRREKELYRQATGIEKRQCPR